MAAFASSATPDLIEGQVTGDGETLYLDIPIGSGAPGGTAVYMPGQLTGALNMLVYFHGNKAEVPQDTGKSVNVAGKTLDDYMKVPQYNLRAIVQQSKKRDFALVVPALSDGSKAEVFTGGGKHVGANFVTFLDMVLNGIKEHSEKAGGVRSSVGDLVLAAHSGGGTALGEVVSRATSAIAPKIGELWCFDSLYGSQGAVLDWASRPGNNHRRAWVYCTGSTSGNAGDLYDAAFGSKGTISNLEISLPPAARSISRRVQNWRMSLDSPDHWKCIGTFMPRLLDTSYTLSNFD